MGADGPSKRVIVVLGMHRSGTSAVARLLPELGVGIGVTDSAVAEDNPSGFWEDPEVVDINRRLMAAMGSDWYLPKALSGEMAPDAALVNEARALLQDRLHASSIWGFKDPRTAMLLPFWQQVFDDLGVEPSYILAIRQPRSVAESLLRRNGLPESQSCLLWLAYMVEALQHTEGARRVIVDYDSLLESPFEEAMRIAAELALPHEGDAESLRSFTNDFIDPGLRHDHSSVTDLQLDADAILVAADLYQRLSPTPNRSEPAPLDHDLMKKVEVVLGRGGERSIQPHNLTAAAFERLSTALDASSDEVARLTSVVDDASRQLQELSAAYEERLAELDEARQALEDANETLRATEAALDQSEGKVDHLQRHADQLAKNYQDVVDALNRERLSILKPVLRRAYRRTKVIANKLPGPVANLGRRIKNRIHPGPVALDVKGAPPPAGPRNSIQPVEPAVLRAIHEAKTGKFDVIVFPVIDWGFRIQRPQHLARQLASKGHRVFYLATTFSNLNPRQRYEVVDWPEANIFVCRLACRPPHPEIYRSSLKGRARADLLESLRAMTDACDIRSAVSIVDLPFWRPLAESVPGAPVIYDCMDHHAGFSTNTEEMLDDESRLIETADLVVTTSQRLSERIAERRENVLIRNGAETAVFERAFDPNSNERPTIGYVGAIADWFDVDWVAQAARAHPDWDFVLVGGVHDVDVSPLQSLANVVLRGEVAYPEVPAHLKTFDVCIIPFRKTELTLCTNPVKVYEYLAAGKPVVATDLPELEGMTDWIYLAGNGDQFVRCLEQAVDESGSPEAAERRSSWARGHDWAMRAGALEDCVQRLYPMVSVVVLTYNNLDFTKACLESLEKNTLYPNWELVIVDNASTDGTPGYLRQFAEGRENVSLILNEENLGFAGGNNRGIERARGAYIVLLNNDTYVTQGWLADLVGYLRRDPSLGLVGPVTNNIGNEAKIEVSYSNMAEMESRARDYTQDHARESLHVENLGFFCVAMPATIIDAVGLLDEQFSVGFFEDDDYCCRVRNAGYGIAIAEGVFVHHHLSASFGALDDVQRQKIFEENRKRFEKKWGSWKAHAYRDSS